MLVMHLIWTLLLKHAATCAEARCWGFPYRRSDIYGIPCSRGKRRVSLLMMLPQRMIAVLLHNTIARPSSEFNVLLRADGAMTR